MRVKRCWGLLAALMIGACGVDRSALSNGLAADPGARMQPAVDGGGTQTDSAPAPDGATPASSTPDADAGPDGGGCDAGDPLPLVRATPVAAIPAGTTKLLGDAQSVFGLTATGMIWVLDAGTTSVRQLVAAGSPGRNLSVALAGGNVFWTDGVAGTLHRTARDGSGDVVLASGLPSPAEVTADDSRVYWLVAGDSPPGEAGGRIESLPLDATSADAPQVLAIIDGLSAVSSMAAMDGSLFWTPFAAVGATMYYARLMSAPVSTLLAGGVGAALPGIAQPYGLVAVGNDIYFGYQRTQWTTVVTRLSDQTILSVLPISVGLTGLTVSGDWLLVTGAGQSRRQQLYATPLESPSGLVVVATDLGCPAVTSPWGVTYVDAAGALVAFSTEQLGYVGFGLPLP